jgi:HD-like signal output (HDOD) protein
VSITRATFQDIIERVHTIPSLPEVVMQVVTLVNDPKSSASMIEEIMSKDPAMAAKILRMVNSVYYGLKQPVNDLEQAIAILGFKTIRSIALSISVINAFQQKDSAFNMKAFWTHGAVMACIGRLMGQRVGLPDPELPFVIGLLKDIGMLILVEHAPEETRAIVALAREYRLGLHTATRKVIATHHAEIGAWLVRHWDLGDEIADAVEHQFAIDEAANARLVAISSLGEYLCALKKIRLAGQCDEAQLDPVVWQHLGLTKTDLVDALSLVNDEVDNARRLIELATG